ncbi:MAG: SDR family oxidoreductase [Spirochaetes bacterium]|jgi:3-oxoacyl-[acyl-carrier protein] reductase|nr:SDR family oxidoreductase [Spirochaetota bacterium]
MEKSILKDKIAIITGASRGIGKAIAVKYASEGAAIVLVSDEEDNLKLESKQINESGSKTAYIAGDVAQPDFADKIVKKVIADFNKIDILVNCAGIITRTPFEELSLEDWNRVIHVNLYGTYYMCKSVLPIMRGNKSGKVINITSQMAKMPHPGASPSYEVSKAGQAALTRHLAYHYAKYNININGIAPGSIDTGLAATMKPEARELLLKGIPLQRLGRPEEVADCALFLASSMSDYITGEIIDVNGGSLMD